MCLAQMQSARHVLSLYKSLIYVMVTFTSCHKGNICLSPSRSRVYSSSIVLALQNQCLK